MTRNVISKGTLANDGTGDSLRDATHKINLNFQEVWVKLGGNENHFTNGIEFDSSGINLLGTQLSFRTRLEPINPTQDQLITIPNASGTLLISSTASVIDATATISLVANTTIFNKATAIAATLSNGTTGQSIKLVNIGTGTVTVTPNSFANGTSFTITTNQACEVIWSGSNWHLINSPSSAISIT